MADLKDVNTRIGDVRNDIISVISSRDEDAFYNTCLKCEGIFDTIVGMRPEQMDQNDKRDIINVLRSLKDVCLQLINIKKTVFNIVNLDDYRQAKQGAPVQEEKPISSQQLAQDIDAKVLSLGQSHNNKRAA